MQSDIFTCREDVESFWANLSYEECWEAMDGYGELDETREFWDREIANGASKETATIVLRDLGATEFLKRHALKYRYEIQYEATWGCSIEEGKRRTAADPFWQQRIEHQRDTI